jgi:hypothetical protein
MRMPEEEKIKFSKIKELWNGACDGRMLPSLTLRQWRIKRQVERFWKIKNPLSAVSGERVCNYPKGEIRNYRQTLLPDHWKAQ